MRIPTSITIAICAAIAFGSACAASHYVDLGGDDANSGLEGSPWRTLAMACNSVEADQGHTIHIGEGIFTETKILKLKSGVNLIGAGSGKTKILVNHPFSLTDAVPGANPHVHTFPEHFVLQMNGGNQVVKGFALDGQEKRCHGGIFAPMARNVVFEDLHITDFRYSGLWVIEAHDTRFRNFLFLYTSSRDHHMAFHGITQRVE